MTILWANLAIVFLLSLMSRYFAVPATLGQMTARPNKLLLFAAATCLILVSGLRNNIGDTFYYMHAYITDDFNWTSVLANKDIGFGILQMVLHRYTEDPQLLVFITAFLTNILILLVLYKYSALFELSVYVFLTSGMFVTSMNGIRQYLAAAIVFAGTKYLLEGNWKRYFLIVLLAGTIHQSALILIPLYFLVRRKAWTATTFLLLLTAVVLVFGFNQFADLLFNALQDTQYSHYRTFAEGGANVIRVGVEAIPLLFAYLGRERLRELFPQIDIFVNLSLLSLIFMLIATQNWIFARMTIYFSLYQLIMIAWMVKSFRKKDQKLIYLAILVFYFIYCFYDNVYILQLEYKSDYLFL
ncbi:MAG: EpsG family protein [Gorillibacterium sp.]|nr:EpsG family protein [Gorillibacterium sp.]